MKKMKTSLMGLFGLGLVLSACAAEKPLALSEMHCGVTFGFYGPAGYFASEQARKALDDMVATHVTWVVVVPTVWQDQYCSTRQYADFAKTPGDLELVDFIDAAHQKGLRVQLRPMLECQDGTGRLGVIVGDDHMRMYGHERGYCRKWFEAMTARSVHYARIAERTKCELYCLDSELDRFVHKNREWKGVVAAVRKVYSGPVTSCHTVHTPYVDYPKFLADRNHWFHDLDLLLISDYARAGKPGESDLTVAQLMKNLEPERERLRGFARLYGKPIVFGECGCSSWKGCAASPSAYGDVVFRSPYDGEAQARYMEAFFRTFKDEPWCYGFYWWKWDDNSPSFPANTDLRKGFTVMGKPSESCMRRLYGEMSKSRYREGRP